MRIGVIGGRSAHVRIDVPLTSSMGGEYGPGADLAGADAPAELEGYGPVPASVARALAAGSVWARLVRDPIDGSVRELTTERYEPPAAMADLVRATHPRCLRPGCNVSSDSCDLHHEIPYPIGPTAAWNLGPGCRRDHMLVTHAGWSYEHDREQQLRTWTTATGHSYIEHADGKVTMGRKYAPPPVTMPGSEEPPPY